MVTRNKGIRYGDSYARQQTVPGSMRLFAVQLIAIGTVLFAMFLPSLSWGFEPATFEPDVGVNTATITSNIKHSSAKTSDGSAVSPTREPAWGDYTDYTFTWALKNLNEPGTKQKPIELIVSFPAGAKPVSDVSASDFALPSGWQVSNLTKESDTTWNLKLNVPETAANGTVTLTKRARIPAKGEAGAPEEGATLWASSQAETSPIPDISLQPGDYSFTPDSDDACAGVFKYQWQTKAGAWLADIKIGDAAGQGKIVLDDEPLVAGTGPNSLYVADALNNDISASVVAKMASYKTNDASRPYLGNPYQAQYPNTLWLHSANWKIDTSAYTGDTWIPAGSTVILRKHGRHLNCSAGIATDLKTSRPVVAALEITRPALGVSDTATDAIQMGGTPPGGGAEWCEDRIYYSDWLAARKGSEFGYIRVLNDGNPVADVQNIGPSKTIYSRHGNGPIPLANGREAMYHSIAASPNFENELYFWTKKLTTNDWAGLIKYDLTTQEITYIPTVNGPGNTDSSMPLGFDERDRLWLGKGREFGIGGIKYVDTEFRYLDMGNGSNTWVDGPTVGTGNDSSQVYDITFDAWGNAYLILVFNAMGKDYGEVWRYSKAKWDAGGRLEKKDAESVLRLNQSTAYQGMAWGPDGKLYTGPRNVNYIHVIDWHLNQADGSLTSAPTVENRSITSRNSTALSGAKPITALNDPANDLAGCYLGKPAAAPEEPKYKLQKSVIDPKTGAVVPPGQAAPNPLPLNRTEPLEVRYVVTVSNIGTVAGTPGVVSDKVSVPTGFTIADVLLDGQSQGKSGSFSFQPSQLAVSGIEKHDVVVKLKADIQSVNWSQAETCGAMDGSYGGGFYNQVTMEGDSDGPQNNYGCVKTEPPAELALKKFIRLPGANTDVAASSPFATDAQYFTLGAGLTGGGVQLSGESATSGATAVDTRVPAGTYKLFEVPNDNGQHTGSYTWGSTWVCSDTSGAAVSVSDDWQVPVKAGQKVTCEIRNQPPVKVHIDKKPVDVVGTNPHIGVALEPDDSGKITAKYRITVTNTSGFTVDTRAIRDHFKVPAGLIWDGNNKATVTLIDAGGAAPQGNFPLSVTQEELAGTQGALLTTGIRGLAADKTVTFQIDIPLQIDTDEANGAQSHAQDLGTCENLTTSGAKHTSLQKGVANAVELDNEDLTYNAIPIKDNIACIPVNVPPPFTPTLPPLPLTGGGSARDLFILCGLGLAFLGGLGMAYRQAKLARIKTRLRKEWYQGKRIASA